MWLSVTIGYQMAGLHGMIIDFFLTSISKVTIFLAVLMLESTIIMFHLFPNIRVHKIVSGTTKELLEDMFFFQKISSVGDVTSLIRLA